MEIPPVINPFKHMLHLQGELLKRFIPIEKLPEYPVDLNTRIGQKVIKDFVRRFIEELSEAYIELTQANEAMGKNEGLIGQYHCKKFNEEIADANHFLMDILLYSGLDNLIVDSLIYNYLQNTVGMKSLYDVEDTWGNLLKLGNFYNQQIDFGKASSFRLFSIEELSDNPEYTGGAKISPPMIMNHSHLLWEVTCQLNMAANELSNRDHNQTVREVNLLNYKEKILYALINWGRYLDYAGFTKRGIWNMYYIKNQKNHERISNGR